VASENDRASDFYLFQMLNRYSRRETEENHENFGQDRQCPDRDSKRALFDYNLEMLEQRSAFPITV
jgi:hypothetical protein